MPAVAIPASVESPAGEMLAVAILASVESPAGSSGEDDNRS